MPWGTAGLNVLGSLEGKRTGYKEEEGESFMGLLFNIKFLDRILSCDLWQLDSPVVRCIALNTRRAGEQWKVSGSCTKE